jgi:L-alanine-DL-glutamate epimerase-like enolase superfamily enzyme
MRITGIETRTYRFPLDPPFSAAWDPVPRTSVEDTLVLVHTDEGITGVAGGAPLPDRALLEGLLKGLDPFQTEVVRDICETVDFHGGRPWTAEVAVWDVVGRALKQPLWRLLGGRQDQLLAYASTGERVSAAERVRRVMDLKEAGVRAVKIRFSHVEWELDLEVVQQVRHSAGHDFTIMVDVNQGWRMAGDRRTPWDVPTAIACARALERCDVYWLEEPLPTTDVEGYRRLRQRTDMRIAAGEMVRSLPEARELVLGGGIDVVQPDAVLAGGIGGCRQIASFAQLCGRTYSPHTWSNGMGLLANLHLACAVSTCPFIEVPFDPPAWSAERRDWNLSRPLRIEADGTIRPPEGPGLGLAPDLQAMERYRAG